MLFFTLAYKPLGYFRYDTYTKTLVCTFNFVYYPFDVQQCTLMLAMDVGAKHELYLHREKLVYTGQTYLAKFYVHNWRWHRQKVKEYTHFDAVAVDFILMRPITSILMTHYLPSLLLNIINYSTNYYGEDDFMTVVTINLTSMIVLASMYLSATSMVATTYLKLIDAWLLLK